MRSLSRATMVFVIALVVIFGSGLAMRDLMHLDCVGPVLPGWGCLAQPFPTSLGEAADTSGDALHHLVIAALLFAACYALRDVVIFALVRLSRRFFPGLVVRRAASSATSRRYRHR